MRTQKQIEASRINGAKSRGPVTPQGKRNSAGNGWRQGILARSIVLDSESRDRFNDLHRSLIAELQPATPIENMLVQKMAVAQWRQMRLWGLEKVTIEQECALSDQASIFESRYDRQFDRALATLERLRDRKKPTEPGKRNKTMRVQSIPNPNPTRNAGSEPRP
jgi:hypothetical protein